MYLGSPSRYLMSVWKHASAVEEEAEDDAGMLVEDEQSVIERMLQFL